MKMEDSINGSDASTCENQLKKKKKKEKKKNTMDWFILFFTLFLLLLILSLVIGMFYTPSASGFSFTYENMQYSSSDGDPLTCTVTIKGSYKKDAAVNVYQVTEVQDLLNTAFETNTATSVHNFVKSLSNMLYTRPLKSIQSISVELDFDGWTVGYSQGYFWK
jgi:predicted nucleic acid-binding Zn ribbon protein